MMLRPAALVLALACVRVINVVAQTVPATNASARGRACGAQPNFPFCNTTLDAEDRITDLIARLQKNEIVPQLQARHGGGGSPAPASNVSRIGLPEYDWGCNCLHGVQSSCVRLPSGEVKCPTSFANPVSYGATWNASLVQEMAAVIADELRALWLLGAVEDSTWSGRPHIGLDCWSPNLNLMREPRWGRNCEVASEDPKINGDHGVAHTRGLQGGEDPRYLKGLVTLKHWDAYSLEDSDGKTRHNFNAVVSNFTLADTYWPAFKAAVQDGGARGVMCSYNAVNGVPSCANSFLTRTVLRDTWGFSGYVTSDSGAIEDIYEQHKYVKTAGEAACAAIRNGTTDVCSGAVYHDALMSAVAAGTCAQADVDAALRNTFRVRFALGLFDPIADQPYWAIGPDRIATAAANASNLLAARSSMVLLKNDRATLPLRSGAAVAVIGPHGAATTALVGNYLGQLCPDDTTKCVQSFHAGVAAANVGGTTTYTQGCGLTDNSTAGFAAAVAAADAADAVVLALGIDGSVENESHDRTSIDLPEIQHRLAALLASAAAAAGKPLVIVLVNGGMVDVAAEAAAPGVGAILEAFYPGVLGARVIGETLFGANDHLGGKLPYTVYPANYTAAIKMSEMEMDVGVGRTYRYYAGPVTYPFGWGLALTNFTHADVTPPGGAWGADGALTLPTEAGAGGAAATVAVNVTNVGAVTGDDVVMAFMSPAAVPARRGSERLIKQLVDYQRVHLAPGQSVVVTLNVSSAAFRLVAKPSGDVVSAPGAFTLRVTNGVVPITERAVHVVGEEAVVAPFPGGT